RGAVLGERLVAVPPPAGGRRREPRARHTGAARDAGREAAGAPPQRGGPARAGRPAGLGRGRLSPPTRAPAQAAGPLATTTRVPFFIRPVDHSMSIAPTDTRQQPWEAG